jgi:hypothetical protein
MKLGLLWIIWGVAMIVFGLVTIWPWTWGSAWSSWVAVGYGVVIIIFGIGLLVSEKKQAKNEL